MAVWESVSTLVSSVGQELGLGSLTAVLPVTSTTDSNVVQLQALLSSTGRRLMKQHPWLQLKVEYTFATTATTTFTMPDGLSSIIDGTAWNRTAKRPLYFASPAEWQSIKANGNTVVTSREVVRLVAGTGTTHSITMEFPATATADHTIAFEYRNRLWVRPSAGGTNLDAPTATTDLVAIDALLFSRALKLAWKLEKGFDPTAAQNDFDEVLATVRSANAQAMEPLYFGRRTGRAYLQANLPESGWGL